MLVQDPPVPDEVAEPETEMAALEARIGQITAELKEERESFLRLRADVDNMRKRLARERIEDEERWRADLYRSFLPVLDNLARAVQAPDAPGLREGVGLTLRQMQAVFAQGSVEAIASDGEPFDPRFHEALSQEERADVPEGQVLETFEVGYRIGDRVLRPARVKVARARPGD